jgi:hypothetical protein
MALAGVMSGADGISTNHMRYLTKPIRMDSKHLILHKALDLSIGSERVLQCEKLLTFCKINLVIEPNLLKFEP